MNAQLKREVTTNTKKGLGVSDIILIAVLLAAGAVLKYFVGSLINIGGMKPNFIIAMYCLAILLIRPKIYESAIIGILAGAVCQLFPGTPYINFGSEIIGALVMGLLIFVPMSIKGFSLQPIVSTFLSTVASGSVYTILLFLVANADASAMVAYVPIVLCTATFNAVIVQALYIPLKKVLHK
ncbi:MAG: hypothetical protein IJ493_07270 [Clostridia bacterium]|nr:hypothetical protein [Clostridia bacterium]